MKGSAAIGHQPNPRTQGAERQQALGPLDWLRYGPSGPREPRGTRTWARPLMYDRVEVAIPIAREVRYIILYPFFSTAE